MAEQITQTRNREQWLHDFLNLAMPYIRKQTGIMPTGEIKLSCGFPSRGGTSRKKRTIGQCFHSGATGRQTHEIFIHPQLDSAIPVGETLLHEVLHAILPPGAGHRKPFSQAAKKVGLLPEGAKPTATWADDDLKRLIEGWAEQLGPYPHESLDAAGGPKQSTRLLKCMCPICGYLARVTLKWIDEAGLPICPQCITSMVEAGTDDVASMPLVSLEQHVTYRVRRIDAKPGDRNVWDERWFVQMHRYGGDRPTWAVVDYGPSSLREMTVTDSETGETKTVPVARLGTFDISMEELEAVESGELVIGPDDPRFYPHLEPATSREDAIGLLESLRDGTLTYSDLKPGPDEGEDIDDPFFLDEEEDEILDTEPEFTDEEMEIYEGNLKDREQGRDKARTSNPLPTEDDLPERIKQLERLARSKSKRGRKS